MATGSPAAPVRYGGRTIPIAQCNNVYIFPAIGLGVVASGARRVTDSMIQAAAGALAEASPTLKNPTDSLLPGLADLRRLAVQIATAVGLAAQKDGVAPRVNEEELLQRVKMAQWTPGYSTFSRPPPLGPTRDLFTANHDGGEHAEASTRIRAP